MMMIRMCSDGMRTDMTIEVSVMSYVGNSLLCGKVIFMADKEQRAVELHISPEELETLVKAFREGRINEDIEVEQ